MRQNLKHFQPVDAIDACHAKYPGQGTFYCRATLDADRHSHVVAVGHMLTSESSWGWRNFFRLESDAFDSAVLNSRERYLYA